MAHEIRVPRLGWSMEEGTFVGWLKQDGDPVKVGEPLFELEGEKATQAVESLDAGTLRIAADAPAPGDVIPVGALLGHLVPAGEGLAESATALPATPPRATDPPASPSVRRLARDSGVALSDIAGSGPGGRISADDVGTPLTPLDSPGPPQRPARAPSTPRARRLANKLGIDWRTLNGSGRAGRIRERDVRAAALQPQTDEPATLVRLSPRRRAIATRMRASRRRTVPVTLTTRANATNLVSLRGQFKTRGDSVPTPAYADILACLAARVLKSHRHMAARWDEAGEHLLLPGDDGFNIGIAVHTDQGLLVPVIRNVANLTLPQVSECSRLLFEKARRGRLTEPEMSGGVFTITNLGGYGVEAFTPVINYPETAILGMGAIRREPVVLDDDRIVPRDQITLSLTFDHCRLDGAPAAHFLQDLRLAVENPAAWLI